MATHIKIKETKNGAFYIVNPNKTKNKNIYKKYFKNCYNLKLTDKYILIIDKIENIEYSIPKSQVFEIKDCGKYWELI